MVISKKKSNVLNDLVQTRFLLTQKLKGMKSNEMDRINMLESAIKPITKRLNVIAEHFLRKPKKRNKYNVENPTTAATTTTTTTGTMNNNNNNKRELIKYDDNENERDQRGQQPQQEQPQ